MNMRKRTLLSCALCAAIAVSCQKKLTFEDMAREQMHETLKDFAKYEFEITDEKVVWSTDSLCVINATVNTRNTFGGEITREVEYILIETKVDIKENISDVTHKEKFMDTIYGLTKKAEAEGIKTSVEQEASMYAIIATSFAGRKVTDRRKK